MGVAEVIGYARQQIGKPYVYGAVGPNSFDCSGLVVAAFKHGAGKTLPHWTGALISLGTNVAKADLQPGDLVFPDSGHVQIYTGNGKVVEAPHTGAYVREVSMWGFWRARRIGGLGVAGTVTATDVSTGSELVPDSVTNLVSKATDSATWIRFGMYSGGLLLILVGLILIAREVAP